MTYKGSVAPKGSVSGIQGFCSTLGFRKWHTGTWTENKVKIMLFSDVPMPNSNLARIKRAGRDRDMTDCTCTTKT